MNRSLALIAIGITAIAASVVLDASPSPAPIGDVAAFDGSALRSETTTSTTTVAATPTDDFETEALTKAESSPALEFTVSAPESRRDRTPIGIQIPSLDKDARIETAGVAPNGDMEVPDSVSDVAWYRFGPAPGEAGSAVLAAHVDLAGQGPGVFYELRTLEPGDLVVVEFDDGTTETYRTAARTIYDKSELPTEAIFRRDGPPVLTLITCGGGFNRQVRSYDSNVVVYAVPIDESQPLPGQNV